MHCACLGIMRKLLCTWTDGPRAFAKLTNNSIQTICEQLLSLRKQIHVEFNRKPRSHSELPRWKATELRTFLLYVGPVVLKNSMPKAIFQNFLLLQCAISILISCTHLENVGSETAEEFLKVFVKHCRRLYGDEFIVYNVHMLLHLKDDVDRYGALDNFSAFPYEIFLNKLKKLIKSPKQPLQQIGKRLTEIIFFNEKPTLSSEYECIIEHSNGPVPVQIEGSYKQFSW